MNDRNFVRMPPDGAGKALSVGHTVEIEYSSGVNTNFISIGSVVEGQNSLTKGLVIRNKPTTSASGFLSIILEDVDYDKDFIMGETLDINGVSTAVVVSQTDLYTNNTHIVSGDNPFNRQSVDNRGAANVRFAEGSVQFDAFGSIQTTNVYSLGSYLHEYDDLPYSFSERLEGNATGFYDSDKGSYILRCTTDPTDRIFRGSNKYHQYHPGAGQFIKLTVGVGDSGKPNVVRRWGYYDENNGIFFELDGTTLNIVLRKNMGNGVEEVRVAQGDWSGDNLDGTGLSQMVVDVDKNNLWWIDLAYLGGGRVRAGVFSPDGTRVTAHTFDNSNRYDYSYMRTGTLPVALEQFNSGAAGSTSEMNFQAASVDQEQNLHPLHYFFGVDLPTQTGITGSDYVHVASFRASEFYMGRENHVVALPDALDIIAKDATTGEDRNVRVAIAINPDITSPTWEPVPDTFSALDYATDPTDTLSGASRVMYVGITYPGKTFNISHLFPYSGAQFITRHFDNTRPHISLFVKPVDPSHVVNVTGDFRWREYP